MKQVQKLNVVYTVRDEEVPFYREKGFCVLDEKGNVVENARPVSLAEYKALCERLEKEIQELKKKKAK